MSRRAGVASSKLSKDTHMLLSDMKFDEIEMLLANNPLRRDFSSFDIQKSADAPNPLGWPQYKDLWAAREAKVEEMIAQTDANV
jgi:hypothetical protein